MQKRYVIILLIISILFTSFLLLKYQKGAENHLPSSIAAPLIKSEQFFDKHLFFEGIRLQEKNITKYPSFIKGGIIPHHQVPSFIQADFFHKLSFQKPEIIFIIGPNHYENGGKIISSSNAWETPFGEVRTDAGIINRLFAEIPVQDNPEVLSNEHSVGALIPYIKYYLPDSLIVPIILSHNIGSDELGKLSGFIAGQTKDKNYAVVSSVDFSHNLTSEKADLNDALTINLIKNNEYEKLFKLDSGFLDSPPSVIVLLQTMENLKITKSDILQHTNSGKISGKKWINTTSYFSIVYYE